MSTEEQRLKEAFDAITLPSSLREDTLRTLAEKRRESTEHPVHITQLAQGAEYAQPAPTAQGTEYAQPAPTAQGTEYGQPVPTAQPATTVQSSTTAQPVHAAQTNQESSKVQALPVQNSVRRTGRRRRRPLKRGAFALAACLMLCALGFGGYGVYAMETALVEIEVNPSLELGINRFDVVVAARANNADGQLVLDAVSLTGRSSDEALSLLTENEVFRSFVNDTSFVDVSVVSEDEQQASNLLLSGQECINRLPGEGRCGRVSAQAQRDAAQAGMSMGRYQAAQALMELDPSVSLQECESMSMRELQQRIAEIDPDNTFAHHGRGNAEGRGRGNPNR